jgi:hypothetical protein
VAHGTRRMQIGERREVGPVLHQPMTAGKRSHQSTTIFKADAGARETADRNLRSVETRNCKIFNREKSKTTNSKTDDFAIGKTCPKRNPDFFAHGLPSLARSRFVWVIIARLVSRPSRRPLRGACGDLDRRSRSRPRHWRAGSAEQCPLASPQNRISPQTRVPRRLDRPDCGCRVRFWI